MISTVNSQIKRSLITNFTKKAVHQYTVDISGAFTHTINITGTNGQELYIDWDDGEDTTVTMTGANQNIAHDYAGAGEYQVKWDDEDAGITQVNLSDENIDSLGTWFGYNWPGLINGRSMLSVNPIPILPDSFGVKWGNITDGSYMFYGGILTSINTKFGLAWIDIINGQFMLFGNNLTSLPTLFTTTWTKLENGKDMLSYNLMTTFNTDFGRYFYALTTAERMCLFCNNLTSLPDSIFINSQNLTTIDRIFLNTNITYLPDSFCANHPNITDIDYFIYGNNNLTSLNDSIFIKSNITNSEKCIMNCDIQDTLFLDRWNGLTGIFSCENNASLIYIKFNANNGFTSFIATGCGLTENAVNYILVEFDNVFSDASSFTLNLSGGTSSAPSGAGATAKTSLISKGGNITTN